MDAAQLRFVRNTESYRTECFGCYMETLHSSFPMLKKLHIQVPSNWHKRGSSLMFVHHALEELCLTTLVYPEMHMSCSKLVKLELSCNKEYEWRQLSSVVMERPNLRELTVQRNNNVTWLVETMKDLPMLESLHIRYCHRCHGENQNGSAQFCVCETR